MSQALPKGMTVADFLGWQGGDPDRHYELIDGQIVMMAPTTTLHAWLLSTLSSLFHRKLAPGSGFFVYTDVGVERPDRSDLCYEADLVVTTTRPTRNTKTVREPLLVAEILSPSTETKDRFVKGQDYRLIPSVQEILFVAQDRPAVEIWRRFETDRWLTVLATGLHAEADISCLNCTLSMPELYGEVTFDD